MKTKVLSLLLVMMLAAGNVSVFAQSTENSNKKPERKRPTQEQIMERQALKMEKELLLDEATAAKFKPLYLEYLKAIKECHPALGQKVDNKEAVKDDKVAKDAPVGPKMAEKTDAEILDMIQKKLDSQKKVAETQQKYFDKFKDILNAKQLEKVFMPRMKHHAMPVGKKPADMRKNRKGNPDFKAPAEGGNCMNCPMKK